MEGASGGGSVDDKELLLRISHGDVKSFGKLIDRYSRYVTAIVCRIAGKGLAFEDIEDLASSITLKGSVSRIWSTCIRRQDVWSLMIRCRPT
jgi:hypothetical protein